MAGVVGAPGRGYGAVMRCAKCSDVELSAATVAGVEVDTCARCGGVWCDDRELQALLDAPRATLAPLRGGTPPEPDDRTAHCPRDGGRLVRMYSSRTRTVTVDACPDCQGIWLDAGELDRLLAAG